LEYITLHFKNIVILFIESMKPYKNPITGHLDILAYRKQDEDDKKIFYSEILIHGDPEGLRSFANLLLKLADLDQESLVDLPVGAREHEHLRPDIELAKSSQEVVVGRLDAKGTGAFYSSYISKNGKR